MSNIFEAIGKIAEEAGALAPTRSEGVPFEFRGINATVNHLAPLLRKHQVIVVPELKSVVTSTREILDKQGQPTGKAITQSEVIVTYRFYAKDGSSLEVTTTGLAQDYSDRSAAQAQSVAFRVALLQTFTLPTADKEPEQQGEETQKVIAEANAGSVKAPAKGAKPSLSEARQKVQEIATVTAEATGGDAAEVMASAIAAKYPGKQGASLTVTELVEVYKAIKAGEV